MPRRRNIYLTAELDARLLQHQNAINISKVCQEALETAVFRAEQADGAPLFVPTYRDPAPDPIIELVTALENGGCEVNWDKHTIELESQPEPSPLDRIELRQNLATKPVGEVRKLASKAGLNALRNVDPYKGGWGKDQLIDFLIEVS